jgi:hypothetical protein
LCIGERGKLEEEWGWKVMEDMKEEENLLPSSPLNNKEK